MLINKTEAYTGKCNDTVAVIIRIIVIYLLAFGLSSCVTLVDFETAQEKTADLVAIVKPDHPVGQTFLAQRGGINSITIWAGNNENSSNTGGQAGSLAIEIYRSPTDDVALVSQQVIPGSRGSLKINFPPLSSQDGEDYYLSLSVSEGEVNIWGQS